MNRMEPVLRTAVLAGIALAWMAALAGSPARAAEPQFSKKMRILFIGNSFTYANDLPGMLIAMMATRGIELQTRQVTPGGCTLEKHWKDGNAVAAIAEGPWDFVVIQEQSQMPVFNPPVTLKYAALLAEAAAKAGAQPIFYMTWAYKDKPEMQAGLAATYMKAGRDANGLVAPAGLAWQRARKQDPNVALHGKDGKHPSPQGTYLTACVLYGTILRRDPAGLPGKLIIDKQVRPDLIMRRQPCNLTTAQVQPLQEVAWKVVEEMQSYKPVGETATHPAEGTGTTEPGTGNKEPGKKEATRTDRKRDA